MSDYVLVTVILPLRPGGEDHAISSFDWAVAEAFVDRCLASYDTDTL
jgi:hypothetical protein